MRPTGVRVAIGTRRRPLVALTITAIVAAAGCSASASSGSNPPTATSTAGPGPGPGAGTGAGTAGLRHPPTPEQVAAELVAGARVPAGATEVSTSPVGSLARPPSEPAVSGRIERIRWWRVDQPMGAVYSRVAHDQSPSLHYDGSSSAGGPALRDRLEAADFQFRSVPLSVNSASFSIAVAPIDAHHSAIGAYAVVVRQPTRPVSEVLPTTVDQVRLSESVGPAVDYASPGPTTPPPVTVTGMPAQQIVSDFNQLRVRPEGVMSCPMAMTTTTATFRYDGHALVATLGICDGVNVTLDGHRLPTLEPTPMFTHDVTSRLRHEPTSGLRKVPVRR